MQVTDLPVLTVRSLGSRRAFTVILFLSAAVFAFLFWIVYFKPAADNTSRVIDALPFANAGFNSLSTIFLLAGYRAIRRRRYLRHMKFMLAALGSSGLFFISYVIYHNFRGDIKFTGHGAVRPIYFAILISHILLSAILVPLILTSFYLALSGKFAIHKRVSRFTFPVWLYVSITGVLIFAMLKCFAG